MDEKYKKLLIKYIEGNCSDQEKVTVTNLIDSDPEYMKEYLSLRKLYDICIWQVPDIKEEANKFSERSLSKHKRSIFIDLIKIAAILIAGAVLSQFLFPGNRHEESVSMQTLRVPAGQRAEITLGDGTKVWLNAKTILTFPNQFKGNTREVNLDGEGFFEVTHDKSKPFIVRTNKYNVRVLGTRFNLKAYSSSDTFETSLLEGKVEILTPEMKKDLCLQPNERVFIKDGQLKVDAIAQGNQFLWKEGIISFDNEPFTEMARKLELYFDLKIKVENHKILGYRCTGKFRSKDGIEHILKVLQLSNNFIYTIDEESNTIVIK